MRDKGDDEDGLDTKRTENRWLVRTGGGRPLTYHF